MKTMSYVQAVKLAVAKSERLGMDCFVNDWVWFMVIRPQLTMYREM